MKYHKKMKYHKALGDLSAQIKFMHQLFNLKGKELLNDSPNISKSTVYKHQPI